MIDKCIRIMIEMNLPKENIKKQKKLFLI